MPYEPSEKIGALTDAEVATFLDEAHHIREIHQHSFMQHCDPA